MPFDDFDLNPRDRDVSAAARAEWIAERRVEAEALAARYRGPLPPGDAGLTEAGRRHNELVPAISAVSEGLSMEEEAEIIGYPGPDDDYSDAAIDAAARSGKPAAVEQQIWQFIVDQPPEGPAGIAVKLRLLRSITDHAPILSQCIAAIEAI